ncbi:hypothetical protein [Fluviicola taffensis]|uniref:Uncharacterized protein n=1 Tax=Fluviicola taffensis (strain DSM 16823 / NCIMB 13979 / RW262) TaxID=755732 RepID=F2I947_FLUTR|nr:hypothetical protein [Fluviicola taffensis]AEA42994.1 hypothetical protein Fluta_0995 [Fluviicola taffensis DSM 16823]
MKYFTLFFFSAFSLFVLGQNTISFRDGKSYTIKGTKLGTNFIYDFNDPSIKEKLVEYYWSEENGEVTITEYSTWLKAEIAGRMDELKVYTFKVENLESNPEMIEETDEYGRFLIHSLNFTMKDEFPLSCSVYSIWKSEPNATKTLKYYSVYCIENSFFSDLIAKTRVE